MAFNDAPLPRTQRGLDERRAAADTAMRRASWMAYFLAAANALGGYLLADEATSIAVALLPLLAGAALAACGHALATLRSRAAGAGLLLCTVAIVAARWIASGRPSPLIPGALACYVFWRGFEAAAEWTRLQDHVLPVDGIAERAP